MSINKVSTFPLPTILRTTPENVTVDTDVTGDPLRM